MKLSAGSSSVAGRSHGYRPDIDGLRGIAVLSVLLYHLGLPEVPGGFLGVDIFFVISGYLITRIIQEEIQNESFSIARFYERRARRILPALLVVLVAVLVIGLVLLPPGSLEELSLSTLSTILFSSNVYFWRSIGYFSTDADFWPLLHTWSLAVEEQFYIAYPLVLLLLAKSSNAVRMSAIAFIALISFLFCVWLVGTSASAAFYLLPSRGWELALGGLIAVWELGSSRGATELFSARVRGVLALLSLLAIFYSIIGYFPGLSTPGWWTVMPVLGCSIIIAFGRGTWVERALSARWLVMVGLISYSLYLWHWPVLSLIRNVTGQVYLEPMAAIAGAIASFVLAAISWKYVEAPFRRKEKFGVAGLVRLLGSATLVLAATSAIVIANNGFPGRLSEAEQVAVEASGDFRGNEACDGAMDPSGPCPIGRRSGAPTVVVWGDSHAVALKPGFDHVLLRQQVAGGLFALGGCPPLLGIRRQGVDYSRCESANERALAWIERNAANIEQVVLVGRWNLVATGTRPKGEGGGAAVFEAVEDSGPKSQEQVFRDSMWTTISRLKAMGLDVTVIDALPEIGWNVPLAAYYHLRFGMPLGNVPTIEMVTERGRRTRAVIKELSAELGFQYVSVNKRLCAPECIVLHAGRPVYADEDHLSKHGAREVFGPALEAEMFPSATQFDLPR